VARAYAGHTDRVGAATTTYIKADVQAVAGALTGDPHPLAVTPDDYRGAACVTTHSPTGPHPPF